MQGRLAENKCLSHFIQDNKESFKTKMRAKPYPENTNQLKVTPADKALDGAPFGPTLESGEKKLLHKHESTLLGKDGHSINSLVSKSLK